MKKILQIIKKNGYKLWMVIISLLLINITYIYTKINHNINNATVACINPNNVVRVIPNKD